MNGPVVVVSVLDFLGIPWSPWPHGIAELSAKRRLEALAAPLQEGGVVLALHMALVDPSSDGSFLGRIDRGQLRVAISLARLYYGLFKANRELAARLCAGQVENPMPAAYAPRQVLRRAYNECSHCLAACS